MRPRGVRGKPTTRYNVLDAIVALWAEHGRPPFYKEIEFRVGLHRRTIDKAVRFLVEEGKIQNVSGLLIPLTHRVVLVPVEQS